MIELPDVRQNHDYDCGLACIRAVMALLGLKGELTGDSIASAVDGMSPDGVERVFRWYRVPVVAGTMQVRDLKHYTATGRPVVCPVSLYGGHWIVVVGVERNWVHYHDPLRGPDRRRVEVFRGLWTDMTRAGHTFDNWGIAVGG